MTRIDFLQYLIDTYQLPKNADECSFYGFFQSFRPNADGLEHVFSNVPNGEKYLLRLKSIFNSTIENEGDRVDMYFIVRTPQISDDSEVINLGKDYLARLVELAGIIKNKDLSEYLSSISDVVIGREEKYELGTDGYSILYHVILDWIIEETDFDHPIQVLNEAYYSIACDPWLTNYFKWPQFEEKGFLDVFEPYFFLWTKGYNCYFAGKTIILSKN